MLLERVLLRAGESVHAKSKTGVIHLRAMGRIRAAETKAVIKPWRGWHPTSSRKFHLSTTALASITVIVPQCYQPSRGQHLPPFPEHQHTHPLPQPPCPQEQAPPRLNPDHRHPSSPAWQTCVTSRDWATCQRTRKTAPYASAQPSAECVGSSAAASARRTIPYSLARFLSTR